MPRVKTTAVVVPAGRTISSGLGVVKHGSRAMATPRGGFDGRKTPPWRKTVSIFKQPVTLVHTTSKETKPAPQNELVAARGAGTGRQEKPKQVFWAKRLCGLSAMMPLRLKDLEENNEIDDFVLATEPELIALPNRIQAVGPDIDDGVAAASLCSSLQTVHGSVTGQTYAKRNLDTNPGAFTNPDQPLVQAVYVQDNDIVAQEKRVIDARSRLEETRKHFG